MKNQIYAGSKAFFERLNKPIGPERPPQEIPGGQRRPPAKSWESYALRYGDRDKALAEAYRPGAYSMQSIAAHFGVSRMTVSRAVKRCESVLHENRRYIWDPDHGVPSAPAAPLFILHGTSDSPAHALAKNWWPSHLTHCDDVLDDFSITDIGPLAEDLYAGVARFSTAQFVSHTVESGTYKINAMIKHAIIDNWQVLRQQGTGPELVSNARVRLVGLFYQCDPTIRATRICAATSPLNVNPRTKTPCVAWSTRKPTGDPSPSRRNA